MKGVVFLTLLLGLVDGRQMVELAAADEAVRVELRVDGEVAAVVTGGPPWRAPVDLGEELAPHRLEASAFDAEGRELGRAEQWLNLPRGRAEVSLLVDSAEPGSATAEIGWRAVEEEEAQEVRLFLDGASVPVPDWSGDSVRVELPPHDGETLHIVTAEVLFPDGSSARADAAFGAPYGDEVATELTGVAVEVDGRRRLRSAAEAGSWLRAGGDELRVVAVDEGAVDVFAVVDASAYEALNQLTVELGRMVYERRPGRFRSSPRTRSVLDSSPLRNLGIREGDRLLLVRPQVETEVADTRLFGVTAPLDHTHGGFAWQLSYLRLDPYPGQPQMFTDALATAGMRAAGSSRPRGLVLILGPEPEDASNLSPERVRGYLDRLGVPLLVLAVDLPPPGRGPKAQAWEAERPAKLAALRQRWGAGVVDIAGADDWLHAFTVLRRELGDQRVLWVEGRHAPHMVDLAAAPDWLRRIGGEVEVEARSDR